MDFWGISKEEVLDKREKYGFNLLPEKDKISWISILFSQVKNPLIYVLFFVAFVSFIFREFFNFFLILGVVGLNVLMGFFQEYNAKKTLLSLRKILKPKAVVIREGKREEIEAKFLVPKDLVVLIAGDKVPADGKLIQGEILISEAILTGEEKPVRKVKDEKIFMGTTILFGKGIMEVEKIGKETEIGKIGKSLMEIKEVKTPLQKKLEELSKNLAKIIIIVCFFIFLSGIFTNGEILKSFETAIVLAVAAIPEALPIVLTVILAMGMKRILKKQGLVKTLLASEVLGSTSIVCLDKTGTLTEGKMKVVKSDFYKEKEALLTMFLNNEQRNGLELALWHFAKEKLKEEAQEIIEKSKEIFEEPFESKNKYSMSIWKIKDKEIAFLMGGPEIILNFCRVLDQEKEKVVEKVNDWAEEGLRVLGLAIKDEGNLTEKKDFQFVGLVGISDPIRTEVKNTINVAQEAGIRVKIVTGDYRKTAEKVAEMLGLKFGKENVIEGKELENVSVNDLANKIDKIILFCRVSPHQKRKIVQAFQKRKEVVAMTGDGVNDALALKEADIGIAVGEATEVAKEAADLVLLDSNFKTIILACEEGRLILSNIKKTVAYVLSNSFLEIGVLFLAGFFKLPVPLTIAQILYLHLICDGPPDLMFAFEPKEKDLMKQKPADLRKESILDRFSVFKIIIITVFVSIVSFFLFWKFAIKDENLKLASTIVFAILGSVDLIYAFSFKDLKNPILKAGNFFSNKFLILAIFYGFLLLILAIYLPLLNKILNTVPLKTIHWFIVIGIGILTFFILELTKVIFQKFLKVEKMKNG